MTHAPLKVALARAPGADLARGLCERASSAAMSADLLSVDPWAVTELVRHGGVDAGVVPKHVLAERSPQVFEVLDLGAGRELLVYAVVAQPAHERARLQVATRHPHLTQAHFAAAARQVDVLKMTEAELAVTLGLADGAVVPVAAGATHTPAGLDVIETIMESSLRVVVGGARRAVRGGDLRGWLEALRSARDEAAAAPGGRARVEEAQ
jgi:ATP phosphoribosyltransferase